MCVCLCVQSFSIRLPLQVGTLPLQVRLFKHLISEAPWRTKPVLQVYLTLFPTEKSLPNVSPFLGTFGLLHSLDARKRYWLVRVAQNILTPVLTVKLPGAGESSFLNSYGRQYVLENCDIFGIFRQESKGKEWSQGGSIKCYGRS